MNVATTILDQLGGNKFIVMTGSKNFIADSENDSLTMKLARNEGKATHLRITLTPMDVYKMEWLKVSNPTKRNGYTGGVATIEETDGVYCDDLARLFTEFTGLYTQL